MRTLRSVESCMSRYPTVVSRKTSVKEALDLMERFQIRHLPVMEGDEVIGITSDRDLKKAAILGNELTLVAPEYMTPDPYCVPEGTALSRVARTMAAKKYGSAVVIDDKKHVVGIFTTTDALEALAQVLENGSSEASHWRISDFLPRVTLV